MYFILALFAVGLTGCNGDDDVDNIIDPEDPTGTIVAVDQDLMDDTIVVQSVSVDQDSWLVAVKASAVNTVISDTVMVEEGVKTNVILTIDDSELTGGAAGTEIMLKLFADNPDAGTQGELDSADKEVENEDGTSASETITVFTSPEFSDFDTNEDGVLDNTEVTGIYENNFDEWDTDDDGELSFNEFNTTTFSLVDMDNSGGIDVEEWDEGLISFFGNWNEDTFETLDIDGNDSLSTDEWREAFVNTGWFDTYDTNDNDTLDEDEWDAGLFDDWDADGNNEIDEDEFDIFSGFAMKW